MPSRIYRSLSNTLFSPLKKVGLRLSTILRIENFLSEDGFLLFFCRTRMALLVGFWEEFKTSWMIFIGQQVCFGSFVVASDGCISTQPGSVQPGPASRTWPRPDPGVRIAEKWSPGITSASVSSLTEVVPHSLFLSHFQSIIRMLTP